MAARGAARERSRGGDSARASLSDLYGSSARTGAAEREPRRVSARADCPVPPYLPPPGLQFTGFCFLSPPAEVWRLPPKAAGERLAGDFQAVPRFLLAEPQPVSASVGRALDVSPRGAGPAVVLIARRWRGPGRRLAPATGSEQGGAREAHPGDVAGARRAGLGLPGGRRRKRGRRCSQPLGRLEAVGVRLRFCRPFLARAARGTRFPPGSGDLRTFSPSRAGGPGRTPGPGAISGPRSPRGARRGGAGRRYDVGGEGRTEDRRVAGASRHQGPG